MRRLALAWVLFAIVALSWLRAGIALVDPTLGPWTPLVWTGFGVAVLFIAADQIGRYAEGR